jgi:hypothetical protein
MSGSTTNGVWINEFEERLSGGHPNSLGNTVSVVDDVLLDRAKLDDLFECYTSTDAVVRLRVSSAMKRVTAAQPVWMVPFIDRFLTDIANLDQPSAQWTIAKLMLMLEDHLEPAQKKKAVAVLKRNLVKNDDWIVQNTTIETLTHWAKSDQGLQKWLVPQLRILEDSARKSVAARARKALVALGAS